MNLYNIEKEYIRIAEEIIEAGGEITPETETALAINKEEVQIKAVKYGYVVLQTEHDIEAIDAEIKRLEAMKKSRANLIATIKERVHAAMDLYGFNEIKMQNLKVSFRASSSTEIEDEKLIPAKYKVKKTTTTINKKDLLADLRAGKKVKGVKLKEGKNIQFT